MIASLLAAAADNPSNSASPPLHRVGEEIVARIRAGDERALETLFHRLANPLTAFSNRFGIDADDADQVVVDVFQDLWLRRAALAPDIRIEAYLFKAVRNRSLHVARGDRRRTRHEGDVSFLDVASYSANAYTGADAALEQQDLMQHIRATISTLPESQRNALYLRYTREMSLDEVSQVMSISTPAVKMVLQRAIRTLRERVGGVFEDL